MSKTTLRFTILAALAAATGLALCQSRAEQQDKLDFLVGEWRTVHTAPSREGEPTVIKGEATIAWVLGGAWLRHEFQADFPGRGKVFTTHMINYSTPKKKYNFTMFDHFGGEAGVFHGDWETEKALVVTAKFEEDDGSTSFQKFTVTRVSEDEIWFSRAFSDDGKRYHFEVKGVYTRKKG